MGRNKMLCFEVQKNINYLYINVPFLLFMYLWNGQRKPAKFFLM